MLTGKGFDYHCHSNLTRAVMPYGLNESDVHDVLNGTLFSVYQLRWKRCIDLIVPSSIRPMRFPLIGTPNGWW